MANFTEHEEGFLNAVIYHINKDWKGEKGKFAVEVGISGSYVSFIIGRKKCPIVKKQETIAKKLGYKNLSEMVAFGKNLTHAELATVIPAMQMTATATHTPAPVIDLQSEADKRHAAVIAEFEDKERAIRLNQKLIELEKLDPNRLDLLEEVLDMHIGNAREKKGLLPLSQKNGTNL
jgi:hypothetical protein